MLAEKIKKKKAQKVQYKKLTFENYENCLEATQLEDKMNYLEQNTIDIDSVKENHKEFIENNKSILKIQ